MGSGADVMFRECACGKTLRTIELCCVCELREVEAIKNASIRQYSTGATRDTDEGKLDFSRALSPIVEKSFVQYLQDHRTMPDGTMRDFDNWKRGLHIVNTLASLKRHEFEVWEIMEPFIGDADLDKTKEENDNLVELLSEQTAWIDVYIDGKKEMVERPALEVLEAKLNAIQFNAKSMLREILTRKGGDDAV